VEEPEKNLRLASVHKKSGGTGLNYTPGRVRSRKEGHKGGKRRIDVRGRVIPKRRLQNYRSTRA